MNERSFIVKSLILTPARRGGLLPSVPKRLRKNSDWNTEILRRFPAEERYLIGVSGGRDSVALLHWLVSQGYRRLVVCHLDHRLRGRSAAADARFVEHLADDLGLLFVHAEKDVRRLAKESRRSIETAARAARYEFFATVAQRRRCRTIFLGHHADDLVETFLMNLFRGTGAEGSRSLQSVSIHAVGATQLTVVRPLLGVWRGEIDEYIAGAKLRFREDASNASVEATRNRMRHQIIPLLEKEFGRDDSQSDLAGGLYCGRRRRDPRESPARSPSRERDLARRRVAQSANRIATPRDPPLAARARHRRDQLRLDRECSRNARCRCGHRENQSARRPSRAPPSGEVVYRIRSICVLSVFICG